MRTPLWVMKVVRIGEGATGGSPCFGPYHNVVGGKGTR